MKNRVTKLLIITVVLTLVLISPAEAQRISSESEPSNWNKMVIKTPRKITKLELQSVSGSSKDDMFAVGFCEEAGTGITTGIIFQYNDKTDVWEEVMPEREKRNLYAVWGGCKSGVFAVGDGGTIFVGCRGRELFSLPSETRTNFRGVWGSSAKDVFFVGNGGAILRYNGNPWNKLPKMVSGVTSDLHSIWGTSSKNVFAVGKKGIIRHYNGNKNMEWSKMESGTNLNLNGIWGSSFKGDINIFAVGDKGTILHYNGNVEMEWSDGKSPTTENINSIWGTSPNNIYAVGGNGTVLHYDGKAWSEIAKPEPTRNLNGVWVSPNPHVYIVSEFIWYGEYTDTYSVSGNVYDLRDRRGIGGVTIKYSLTGNPPWTFGKQTTQDGAYDSFDVGDDICWLQFSATDFETKEKKVTLLQHCNIVNETYMVYTGQGQSSHCIAGVISEACQEDESYNCPVKEVTVKLYKAEGCEFPGSPLDTSDPTGADGFYSFTGLGDGIYKVEPLKTGYTFTPQYPDLSQPPQTYSCDFVPSLQ